MKLSRQTRIRKKIRKVSDRPTLTVSRSNNYVYAQIIDNSGKTLLGLSSKKLVDKNTKLSPVETAKKLGEAVAKLALDKKITEVTFDKGSYAYHGRVKAIADGARAGGLVF
jgi:large subunit ribosomal protein L18